MFKKCLAIAFALLMISNVNAAWAKEKEVDSFQQVMNYLTTGNTFDDGSDTIYRAVIFDRKKCIAGWKDKRGGYIKFYWNNVNKKSIRIQDIYVDGFWFRHLVLSGHPHVVDIEPKHWMLRTSLAAKGVPFGKNSHITMPTGKAKTTDKDRLVKALQLLYSKHCTGLKRKSAF